MGIFKFAASLAGATAIKVYAGVEVVKEIMQHGYKISPDAKERISEVQPQSQDSTKRKIGNYVVNFTPYVNLGASYVSYVNLKKEFNEILDDDERTKTKFNGALVKMTDEELEAMASLPTKTDRFLYWGSLMDQQPRKTAIDELYGDLLKDQERHTSTQDGDKEEDSLGSFSSMLSEIFGDSIKGKKGTTASILETFMDDTIADLFGSVQDQAQDGQDKPKVKKKGSDDSFSYHQSREDK